MGGLPRDGAVQGLLQLVAAAALHKHRAAPFGVHARDGLEGGHDLDLPPEITLLEHPRADLVRQRAGDQEPVGLAQVERAAERPVVRRGLGAELHRE